MKRSKIDPQIVLQLLGIREQIDDLLDGGGDPIKEKPAKPAAKKARARRGPGGGVAPAGGGSGGGGGGGGGGARKLAIVVGHTAAAPGAFGRAPISQSEYPWNKDLAAKIVSECRALGVSADIFLRDEGGISGAYSRAAASGAKAVIELHFNADGGAARGTETLWGAACAQSEAWAQRVHDAMLALYSRGSGLPGNRRLKQCPPHPRGGSSVNALRSIPSCLIEPFFGDHATDAALGHSKKNGLAKALAEAFAAHF